VAEVERLSLAAPKLARWLERTKARVSRWQAVSCGRSSLQRTLSQKEMRARVARCRLASECAFHLGEARPLSSHFLGPRVEERRKKAMISLQNSPRTPNPLKRLRETFAPARGFVKALGLNCLASELSALIRIVSPPRDLLQQRRLRLHCRFALFSSRVDLSARGRIYWKGKGKRRLAGEVSSEQVH